MFDEHQAVMKEINKNKEFIKIVYKDDSIIAKMKREEEENIDIAFNKLMRMMKIIIENARQKFKTQTQKYFNEIVDTIENMKLHKGKGKKSMLNVVKIMKNVQGNDLSKMAKAVSKIVNLKEVQASEFDI